jgi:putative membrane protein
MDRRGLLIALALAAGCSSDRESRSPMSEKVDVTEAGSPVHRRTMERGGPLSARDREFVTMATSGGMFEVDSSQLALQRAQWPQHKDFAQMMIDDHGKANQELKALASQLEMDMPRRMQPKHQRMLDELRETDPTEFDQRYHQMQVQAHDEAIALFEDAARNCQNAELKAWAQKTLPTLRKHREHLAQHRPPQGA